MSDVAMLLLCKTLLKIARAYMKLKSGYNGTSDLLQELE